MTRDAAAEIRVREPAERMIDALTGRTLSRLPDRALLARLRRGAGQPFGDDADAAGALFEVLPAREDRAHKTYYLEDAYLVATLFALHPPKRGARPAARSLGASLRETRRDPDEAAPRRLLDALLMADREDLPWHLRSAVTFVRSRDVPIGYYALWRDVRGWGRERRGVQRQWARDFHNVPKTTQESDQ